MKVMGRLAAMCLAMCLVLIMGMAFTSTVYARCRGGRWAPETTVQFFTADGVEVNWQGGFSQNDAGNWMFGRGCWFVDDDGNVVNVWGSRIYCADGYPASGNFGDRGRWGGRSGCRRW
jgi:hypothetical protein